jgi:hypothetical protein
MEVSVLEQAEAILEAKSKWKRRKRKRMSSSSASDYGEGTSGSNIKRDASRSKKRCRIVTVESSDSDSNSQTANKASVSCVDRVQEQIPTVAPKIRTESVNTNSAGISNVGNTDAECMYKASVGCGALGESRAPTEKSVCKPEVVAVTDEWDWDDWNFDNLELSSFKEACVKREHGKLTVACDDNETKKGKCLSSGKGGMVPPRKLVPKAVRSLSAEFDREAIQTSVSDNSVPRQWVFIDAGNPVLSPPESSIAALSEQQQFEALSTTVLEVSQT